MKKKSSLLFVFCSFFIITLKSEIIPCGLLRPQYSICYGTRFTLDIGDNAFTKTDYSAFFNGKGCLVGPDNEKVNFKSGNLSIATWIYPISVYGKKVILSKLYSPKAAYGSYFLYIQDGTVRFTTRIIGGNEKSSITVQSPTEIKPNEWSHIAVQCSADSGFIRLYINGVKKDQAPWSGRFYTIGKNQLTVGAIHQPSMDVYNDHFMGYIDHIRIWRKVYPVKAMVNQILPKDSLLLAYEFSENFPKTIFDQKSGLNNATPKEVSFSSTMVSPFYKRKTPQYIWNTGDSTPLIEVNNKHSDVYKVVLKTKTGSCQDSSVVEVTPEEQSILGVTIVKRNSVEDYTVPTINHFKYEWIITGGDVISGNGSNRISVKWGKKGKGTISLQETNERGCKGPLVSLQIEKKKKL